MIKQIAGPLQILSEAEVLRRACHAVVGSINYHEVGKASVKEERFLLPPMMNHTCKTMPTFEQQSEVTIKQSKLEDTGRKKAYV